MNDTGTAAQHEIASRLGLPSLGLLMQLFGGGFALIAFASAGLLLAPDVGGGDVWTFVLLLLCVVRSALHGHAGHVLSRGSAGGRRAIQRYCLVALIQSIAVVVLGQLGATGAPVAAIDSLGIFIILASWPLALLIYVVRVVPEQAECNPTEDVHTVDQADQGLQGAGVLMTVLGSIGLIVGCLWLYLLAMGGLHVDDIGWMSSFLLVALLVVRSIAHTSAGMRAMRGTGVAEYVQSIDQYKKAGWLTMGFFLLFSFTVWDDLGRLMTGLALPFIVVVASLAGLLVLWPLILSSYAKTIAGASVDAPVGQPPFTRESAITAIGFWLLAQSTVGISGWIAEALGSSQATRVDIATLPGLPGWLEIVSALTALWVAVEVLTLSKRYPLVSRIGAVILGTAGVWAGVASWGWLPSPGGGVGLFMIGSAVALASILAALIVPSLLLYLSFRSRDSADRGANPQDGAQLAVNQG